MEGPASPMDTNVDDPPTPTMDDHDDGPQSPAESPMQDGPQSPTGPASPDMDMGPASPTQPQNSQSPAQPRSPDTSAVADTSETVASPSQDVVASPPQSPVKESSEQDILDKDNDVGAMGDKEESNKEAAQSKVSSNNLDLAKVHDDHVELDFDEELEEIEEKEKSTGERVLDKGKEEGETAKDEAEQDDGQLSDQGSEEGEIKESDSSSDDLKSDDDEDAAKTARRPPQHFSSHGPPAHSGPMPAPICRFFERGSCTWGINCRFLHPGVNDNNRFMFGPPRRPGWVEEDLLPPPPMSPPQESAWERGLRHAKKLREMASKRKEEEPDFEQKRLNLKVEEDGVELSRDNERRGGIPKDPYYDQPYEDDYYDQERQAQESWGRGQYDSQFEGGQWGSRGEAPPHLPPQPRGGGPMPSSRYPAQHPHPQGPHAPHAQHPGMYYGGAGGPGMEHDEFGRDRFPGPADRRRFPTPPERRFADAQMFRGRGRDMRGYRGNGYPHYGPEEHMGRGGGGGHPMMRDAPIMRGQRGDGDWKDPWARVRSPKHGSPGRGRRRRRRRGYRSRSGSFSSSSYSSSRSRSRSRSSGSYSSYSRSSYSRSSSYSSRSRSRSPSIPAAAKRPHGYKPPPHQMAPPPHAAFGGRPGGKPMPQKPSEPPRSQVSKPAPMPAQAPPPPKMQKKPVVGQVKLMVKRPEKPNLAPPPPQQQKSKLPPGPLTGPMPGKKQSHHSQKAEPLPGRSRLKDRQAKLKRGSGFSSSSSSSSTSRSRSRSSSASSASSGSSGSGSGSSSASADSDDLYRDIPKHDRPRPHRHAPAPPPHAQPPLPPSPHKQHRDRRSSGAPPPGREHRKLPQTPSPRKPRDDPRSDPRSDPRADPRSKHAPPGDPRGGSKQHKVAKSTSQPAAFRDVRESKDPMKLSGQKTGIKLTLVNKGERERGNRMAPTSGSSRMPEKRSMPAHEDGPPVKRSHHQQRSPAKADGGSRLRADPRSPKAPLPPPPLAVKSPPVKKQPRSATNRREELLKQLKAVENAIAKKRHK